MEKIQIEKLIAHCKGITTAIIIPEITPKGCILVRDVTGHVYEDDVTTHHLAELLLQLDSERFSQIIDSTTNWFIKERKDLHNPFFVTTLTHAGRITTSNVKGILQESILSQRRKSGLIDMYAAFLDGGSLFSTLWATEILLSLQVRDEYDDIIKSALQAIWSNWQDIHRTSFKGFFLELLIKFGKTREIPNPKEIIEEIIEEQQEESGLWDNGSYLYTAYILSNLTYAANNYPKLIPLIERGLITLFDIDKETEGPPRFVVDASKNYVESLYLQTCMRTIISADRYLKIKGYKNNIAYNIVDELVGSWPKVYYYARSIEARIKEMEMQYGDIEKEFRVIRDKSRSLLEKSPYHKNVFIMMPLKPLLEGDERYVTLVNQIKKTLKNEGYKGWVATDVQLDPILWGNVAAYMEACNYGIAIFTRLETEEDIIEVFNPNVSLEIGFLLSRGKKVLILKDLALKRMTADLVGHLYKEFDLNKPSQIRAKIREWIRDIKKEQKG